MAKIDTTLAEPSIKDGEMDAGFSNERNPGLDENIRRTLKTGPHNSSAAAGDSDLMRGYTDG